MTKQELQCLINEMVEQAINEQNYVNAVNERSKYRWTNDHEICKEIAKSISDEIKKNKVVKNVKYNEYSIDISVSSEKDISNNFIKEINNVFDKYKKKYNNKYKNITNNNEDGSGFSYSLKVSNGDSLLYVIDFYRIDGSVNEWSNINEGLFGYKKEKVDPETIMNKAIEISKSLWTENYKDKADNISLHVDMSACSKYVCMPKLVFADIDEIYGGLISNKDISLIRKFKSDLETKLRSEDITAKCSVSQLDNGTLALNIR